MARCSASVAFFSAWLLWSWASAALRDDLQAVQDITRAGLDEVRQVARRLRPGVLDDLGLASAMKALANDIGEASRVPIDLRLDEHLPSLSPPVELVIYRIAQEALTNIARHADASRVKLSLMTASGTVQLRVADNGRGLNGAAEGAGIRGMRERAILIGADLSIDHGAEGGTEVRLTVMRPLDRGSGT